MYTYSMKFHEVPTNNVNLLHLPRKKMCAAIFHLQFCQSGSHMVVQLELPCHALHVFVLVGAAGLLCLQKTGTYGYLIRYLDQRIMVCKWRQ